MYTVQWVDGKQSEFEAKGLTIDNGNLLFFRDVENGEVNRVVPQGQWSQVFIDDDSDALRITGGQSAVQEQQATQVPVQSEAGSGEEVREAREGQYELPGFENEDETKEEKIRMTEVLPD